MNSPNLVGVFVVAISLARQNQNHILPHQIHSLQPETLPVLMIDFLERKTMTSRDIFAQLQVDDGLHDLDEAPVEAIKNIERKGLKITT